MLATDANRLFSPIGRAPSKRVFLFALGAGDYRSYFRESTTYRTPIASVDKMIYLSSQLRQYVANVVMPRDPSKREEFSWPEKHTKGNASKLVH